VGFSTPGVKKNNPRVMAPGAAGVSGLKWVLDGGWRGDLFEGGNRGQLDYVLKKKDGVNKTTATFWRGKRWRGNTYSAFRGAKLTTNNLPMWTRGTLCSSESGTFT